MRIIAAAVILAVLALPVQAQQTRLYGPDGRSVGTIATDSAGSKRFYDARGRSVGTSSTDSQGVTTIYDGAGRRTGTITKGK